MLENGIKITGLPEGSVTGNFYFPVGKPNGDTERVSWDALKAALPVYSNTIKKLDKREICYGQGININDVGKEFGATYTSSLFGCTSYIDCYGAREIEITMPVRASSPTQGLVFYDSNKVAIANSGILRPQGAGDGSEVITIEKADIPADAHYFRASYWNFDYMVSLGVEFSCEIDFEDGILNDRKLRPFQSGMINYSVIVNQGISNFWDTGSTSQEPESFKAATGVLILPDDYDPNGKPVPLIMYAHGLSRAVSYQFWGTPATDNTDFLAQKERYRAAGFAVFDVNGPLDAAGAAVRDVGCPQSISAYYKAYQYVLEHYNVEPQIYVIGASAGGLDALNFCFAHQIVRALILISAWTSSYNCAWGQSIKDPFVTFFGFANTTSYEASKVQGFDPWTRIMTIDSLPKLPYSKHPVKLWIGSLESASVLYPYAINYMAALANAGSDAQVRIVDGADHSITYGGSEVADNEMITWMKKR